jgi:pilus assembly protein CpaB
MKTARLVVLGIALVAGGAAAYLMSDSDPAPAPVVVQAPPPPETEDVLVAAKDLPFGTVLADADIRWQGWPKGSVPPNAILKSQPGNAIEDVKGSVVRGTFGSGEPLRRERLVKGPNPGFMSAALPAGSRAVAINIDATGATTAGGFILPNDRVDIIRTFKDDDASKANGIETYGTETILSNVRVLAIGQNVQERNNQPAVVGSNATLELSPRQAEMIVLAQRVGQLSLVLRSLADAQPTTLEAPPKPRDENVTIVRYGISTSTGAR